MANSNDMMRTASLSSDSMDRWSKHAISKLSKGYKLSISKTRIRANFIKEGGGYETCPHRTATRLIKEGYLEKIGEDEMGDIYTLKADFKEKAQTKKKKPKASPIPKKEPIEDLPEDDVDIDLDDDDEITDELEEELGDEEEDDLDDGFDDDLDD